MTKAKARKHLVGFMDSDGWRPHKVVIVGRTESHIHCDPQIGDTERGN